ncbi:MAG: alpha/beta hydrolase [Gammaproteobacteria bacterium]|nr:alpha/beta hydrolase [Gammaproteobacteria bacterium]
MARWDANQQENIPDWFWEAIGHKSTRHQVEFDECDVNYREWGATTGDPLLFLHGMYGHSGWWDFIAPSFLNQYRPVAMDLTGMGDSDYRWEYDSFTYASEIKAVCDDANLSKDVILVAHSFGGRMAVKACALYPDRFKALVLVDSGIHSPDEEIPDYPPLGGGRAKTYPSREAAESRFRLYPPQPCTNQYLLDYIAKNSLMPVDGGFAWKYDEDLASSLTDVESDPDDFRSLNLPVSIIYGADSLSFTKETLEYTMSLLPNVVSVRRIEDAEHHVFLDQPLEFTETLLSVLAELKVVAS